MKLIAASWVGDLLETAVEIWNDYILRAFQLLVQSPVPGSGAPTEPALQAAGSVVESIVVLTKGVGIGILTLCFLIGIARQYSSWQEIKGAEQIIPLFFRVGLAFAVTIKGVDLLWWMVGFGQSLARTVITRVPHGDFSRTMAWPDGMIETANNNLGLFESIPFLVAALVAIVAFFVLAVSILLTIYGRFFELYMHMAFASIMLPTLASTGTERIGWAYLKGFLGIALKAAVIGVAFVIFITVMDGRNSMNKVTNAAGMWKTMAETAFYMLLLSVTVKASDTIIGKMIGG